MRRTAAACLIVAALSAAGCVTHPADGSPRVQSSGQANRENLQGAVKAPLRDLNLLRTKIPEVLLAALADPYARPPSSRCPDIAAQVTDLNLALGADLDVTAADEESLLERGRESAYGAVAGVTTDAIPFRGWVRKLTGAERHDKLVQGAITAGAVRRAYLKGLGEARGCRPPATPSHERTGTEMITQEFRPRYPTRIEPEIPDERPPAAPRK